MNDQMEGAPHSLGAVSDRETTGCHCQEPAAAPFIMTEKSSTSCGCTTEGNCCAPPIDRGSGSCCSDGQASRAASDIGGLQFLPMAEKAESDEPCCGPPQGPPSSPYAKAGYRICRYVEDFVDTAAGPVPQVAAALKFSDYLGTLRARIGFRRDQYKVAPGLYCVGRPGAEDPVLVTANYKLSFDSLRQELGGISAWILVLDTRGVNVWCAAGKKNFSSDEVIKRVKLAGLAKIVSHRRLILPQLGAPGVAAHRVKKGCGFSVIWGPIRARDLRKFLGGDAQDSPAMRQVTFPLAERAVLIPVELSLIIRPTLWVLCILFVISGIGPDFFSVQAAWLRGLHGAAAYAAGVVAGAVAVPLLLPWLPGRQFFIKGLQTGLLAAAVIVFSIAGLEKLDVLPMVLLCTAVSSYAAMNFTGSTPFTSPTGVEKEMRQGIPLQTGALAVALIVWLISPFVSM